MQPLVVTSIENHQIIHLFNIVEIFNKLKIFEYHQIGNFINNIELRKLDILSEEKISECSCFVLFIPQFNFKLKEKI